MKKLIVAMTVLIVGVSAQAAMPSFADIAQAELQYVKAHAGVKSRVATLGGSKFQATEKVNNIYTIVTDNGCAFNARISYGEYGFNAKAANKGISALTFSKAVCN